ncbi:hypothetical protein ACUDCK_18775 [Achromobacter sp. CF-sbj1-Ac2-l]|nr:hypothetical protein [Achromobacter dolens]
MTGDALRNLFLSKYQEFRKRLRIRLGSEDLANDAMQEAWLRVDSLAERAICRPRAPSATPGWRGAIPCC